MGRSLDLPLRSIGSRSLAIGCPVSTLLGKAYRASITPPETDVKRTSQGRCWCQDDGDDVGEERRAKGGEIKRTTDYPLFTATLISLLIVCEVPAYARRWC